MINEFNMFRANRILEHIGDKHILKVEELSIYNRCDYISDISLYIIKQCINNMKYIRLFRGMEYYISFGSIYFDRLNIQLDLCEFQKIRTHYIYFEEIKEIMQKSTKLKYLCIYGCNLNWRIVESLRLSKTLEVFQVLKLLCYEFDTKLFTYLIDEFIKHDTLKILHLIGVESFRDLISYKLQSCDKCKKIIYNHIAFIPPHYNYYSDHVHVIIYYRNLCLMKRSDILDTDHVLKFVCCYAPIWIVMKVCELLKYQNNLTNFEPYD